MVCSVKNAMNQHKKSLSVIIPLLNEEENVEPVTKEIGEMLQTARIPYEIICVSNGSTDRTEEIVRSLSQHDPRIKGIYLTDRGYSLAVITGFASARMDLLTIMSGDGQVDPSDLLKAYETMEKTNADIVKPRRRHRSDGWHRAFLAAGQTILLKILFGLPGWDIDGPPKILKREFAEKLALESREFFIDPEIMIKTKHAGGQMVEIDVGWRERKRGTPIVAHALFKTSWRNLKTILHWRIHYHTLVVEKVPKLQKRSL